MTSDAKRLIKVFLTLSDDDKKEVNTFTNDYVDADFSFQKKQKQESLHHEENNII